MEESRNHEWTDQNHIETNTLIANKYYQNSIKVWFKTYNLINPTIP